MSDFTHYSEWAHGYPRPERVALAESRRPQEPTIRAEGEPTAGMTTPPDSATSARMTTADAALEAREREHDAAIGRLVGEIEARDRIIAELEAGLREIHDAAAAIWGYANDAFQVGDEAEVKALAETIIAACEGQGIKPSWERP